MTNYRKDIKNKYGIKTYQETKNMYDWLVKAIHKGKFPDLKIESSFWFDVSEISYACEGISEFVENAYGQSNFKLTMFCLHVKSGKDKIVSIFADRFKGVTVSAESKVMLERIVNLIENTSLDETEVNDPISVTYVETQINNDGVIIHGDGNVVANNHSEVEVEKAEGESAFKKFWTGVWQNIASNFMWYLITLALGALGAYLAMRLK